MKLSKKSTWIIGLLVFLFLLPFISPLLRHESDTSEPPSSSGSSNSFEIQTITSGDFEMDYFSFGTGDKTFVILPGASLKSVMLSAQVIAENYACFADEYTVYVLDGVKNIPEHYTVVDMAEATAQAMQKLGLKHTYVLGCSLGGMIAQHIAIHHPQLIDKMVLGSTLCHQNAVSTATCEEWSRLADSGDVRSLNRKVFQMIYSPEFYDQYKDVFASMENDGTPAEMQQFSRTMRACGNFDLYDELDKITCPVLVMGSWDDHTLSWEGLIDIAQKLHCPLYMYSGYGHAVYDEAPDYKDRILAFFAE